VESRDTSAAIGSPTGFSTNRMDTWPGATPLLWSICFTLSVAMRVPGGETRAKWALVAVSALVVGGCGSSGQKPRADASNDRPGEWGDATSGDVDAPAPPDAFTDSAPDAAAVADAPGGGAPAAACRAAIESQCRRQVACRGGDVDGCVATVVGYCPAYYFNAGSLRTVAEIESCLPDPATKYPAHTV